MMDNVVSPHVWDSFSSLLRKMRTRLDKGHGNAQVAPTWASHSSSFQSLFSEDGISGSDTNMNPLCVRQKSRGSLDVAETKSTGAY